MPPKSAYQGSSKSLLETIDGRSTMRDFKDMFAALMSTVPLTEHRVRFRKVEDTFTSEDAMAPLACLKVTQRHTVPDHSDPTKTVQTTTSTTWSMGRDMARSTCQQLVDARFIEAADGKVYPQFPTKGAIWQVTPKGCTILKRWVDRNGQPAPQLEALCEKAQMQLVVLERDMDTDRISLDKTTVEVVFRRMCGMEGPNLKANTTLSDSDSVSDYATGLVGVKMAKDRRVMNKTVPYTFMGKAAADWLQDCCTTIDRRECLQLCESFVRAQLMAPVIEDRNYQRQFPSETHFQPTKNAIYAVTEKGQRICGWLARPVSMSSEESTESDHEKVKIPRDTNMNRFNMIVHDPALRMLFREHLKMSLCEENLNFWMDVQGLLKVYHNGRKENGVVKPEYVKDCLATAYNLYNSFLATGAPSELNIDHSLRHRLDEQIIQTETDNDVQRARLERILHLIELAASSVAKLMASDSVPKFLRDTRYQSIIREHQIDMQLAQRALSPAPVPGSPSTIETAPSPASTSSNEKPVLSRSNTSRKG
ncbi:hypothetical protein LTS08_001434 [Lithohypha guttulata]|uniref:uncharacterized protein n=1 Tax=Lithohypha guttulata TaxID=1690604 RepID=UPI002DDEDA50|nr:hypothetical protein LTR51_003900 [Lithohypha guttulata]KAK5105160.1 hypothetical protein LTS08_001434 [Lithohypha guttulata]